MQNLPSQSFSYKINVVHNNSFRAFFKKFNQDSVFTPENGGDDDTLSDVSNDLSDVSDAGNSSPVNLVEDSQNAQFLSTLGVDLSIECIPRYQKKPKSMYTFICSQDYRRDEYSLHYWNWVIMRAV